ncbi:MAG: exonuclease [Candidatus Latescibacteria bacterium]|nr:exonuclease [Candidatus Latescibacterota bacterium]
MLHHTFCHVPGIGAKLERRLWDEGVRTWGDALNSTRLPFSAGRAAQFKETVRTGVERLDQGDTAYFYEHLPPPQYWRLFPHFRHRVAYLDIETTGLGGPDDYITTIVVYDGEDIRTYVQGDNLPDFKDDIDQYELLVTYNGKSFDLPFIRQYFRIAAPQAHIDLRHVLAALGYRGGLKGCERQLGMDRGLLEEVDGYFAVLLWFDFLNGGNDKALETLLAYNTLDVINLEALMVRAFNLQLQGTPFADQPLSEPVLPDLPFRADQGTIRRLKGRGGWRAW